MLHTFNPEWLSRLVARCVNEYLDNNNNYPPETPLGKVPGSIQPFPQRDSPRNFP